MTWFSPIQNLKPKADNDGSAFPSMNSRKAPPPVEQYEILLLSVNILMAKRVSPPPAKL
jgi:hypothetical protein